MFYLTTHSTHFIYGYMASERYTKTMFYFVGLSHTSNTLSPAKHFVIICRSNTLQENHMFSCRHCRQKETDRITQ